MSTSTARNWTKTTASPFRYFVKWCSSTAQLWLTVATCSTCVIHSSQNYCLVHLAIKFPSVWLPFMQSIHLQPSPPPHTWAAVAAGLTLGSAIGAPVNLAKILELFLLPHTVTLQLWHLGSRSRIHCCWTYTDILNICAFLPGSFMVS